jgi:hypothetical protein
MEGATLGELMIHTVSHVYDITTDHTEVLREPKTDDHRRPSRGQCQWRPYTIKAIGYTMPTGILLHQLVSWIP